MRLKLHGAAGKSPGIHLVMVGSQSPALHSQERVVRAWGEEWPGTPMYGSALGEMPLGNLWMGREEEWPGNLWM